MLYRWPAQGQATEDKEDIIDIRDNQSRLLRGSAFHSHALIVRSAHRDTYRPSNNLQSAGLRVARTFR